VPLSDFRQRQSKLLVLPTFVGSIGHIAAFSFCQDKIISTGGEGGMLVTDNEEIFKKCWACA